MGILRSFLDRPIRSKISAGILVLLLGISAFNFLFFPARQERVAFRAISSKGESAAALLAREISAKRGLDDIQFIEASVGAILQDPDFLWVKVLRYPSGDTLRFKSDRQGNAGPAVMQPDAGSPSSDRPPRDQMHAVGAIKIDGRVSGLIILGFDPKSPRAEAAQTRKLILAVDVVMIILGLALAHLISIPLTKPIRRIARAADRLTEGEWGIQIPLEHSDEVGVLAGIFNRMSLSLKESKDELEQYSRTLAQKVEERTAELTKANRELAANEYTITKMLNDLNSVNRELGQTKGQLENIFKSVVDRAIITIDSDGRITFYSKSSELIFGYEVAEVMEKMWLQDFFASESDFIYILLEHTREAGIYKGEVELMRRGKQSFSAMVTITPLKGEEGNLVGYTLMAEDITQKKKTEENIRLLSFAVESATDGAVVVDLEGKILFVNQSHSRMHGYEPFEMTGRRQKDFYPESYWPILDQALQQIFVEGSWSAELEEPRKDRGAFPAQISSSLIKDPEGRPLGILSICKDISEKKRMEREILRSNRELSALNTIASAVGQSLDLREILDRSLSAVLDLSHCEAGWVMLLDREGGSRMNLVAHRGLSLDSPEQEAMPAGEDCPCWEVVRSKQPRLIEMQGCPRLAQCVAVGSRLPSHMSIPLKSKDQTLGVMNLAWEPDRRFSERDIGFFSSVGSEIGIAVDNALLFEDVQKTKDKLQRLNRKLEEASQIKSEFLANTSHELRTPLNSIIGFLGLALDGYCANREEEREFLRNAQQSAKHLLAIINDVLDLAKIEAGRMELELGEVDLKMLLDEVRSLAEVQAQQKKLKLKFQCPDDPSPRVYADSGKLRQVLVNLVGNAIKFTDRGSITVRSMVRQERGNVLIEVQDTGVGVPPEMKDRLFEKFRQVDGSSTRRHGGTGLGLTITKNLVEMMGGVITLESEGEGKGTVVSFTVPVFREAENGESAYLDPGLGEIQGNGSGPLVLIAEDDPAVGAYLEDLLQGEGFTTVQARNGDDAVNAAKDHHPQIMLLDFSLSQRTGGELKDAVQVMRILRKDPRGRDAQVMIVTGQDAKLVEKRLRESDLDPVPPILTKPLDRKVLLDAIKRTQPEKKEEARVG
jgi:PAS domain S-box-containing protein